MLYNTHLATLIKVAEAGSFRQAAAEMHISPSAVLKQIDLLEADLGVSVFERTRKGVELTRAGESVYRDSRYIIRYCEEAALRAREAEERVSNMVSVACSTIMPGRILTDLWQSVHQLEPEIRIHLTTFINTRADTERICRSLGQEVDIIPCLYDERMKEHFHCSALKLTDETAGISMPRNHRLAEKKKLTLEDLDGEILMMPEPGQLTAVDALRREIAANHPGIHIRNFERYTPEVFYDCQNEAGLLLTFHVSRFGNQILAMRAVDWNCTTPYGLLYERGPSERVRRVIEAAERLIRAKKE